MTPSAPRKALVGLIGAGIQRSLTPAMHEQEAAQHGLRLHYQLIDLDRSGVGAEVLPTLMQAVRVMGFDGLNITYPCKQAVIPLLDELSDEARTMGAVNTVVCRDGRLIGHNTDGAGWVEAFQRRLPGADLSRVALLGAGGAGAAIAHAALRMGVRHLVVNDRDAAKAEELVAALQAAHGADRASAQADVALALQGATGLIHATPTGMDKLPGLPLPEDLLHAGLWVADVVYFPLDTALLKAARARGCATVDGGGMAVGQALGAFRLFTGLQPDAQRVEAHFRQMLAQRADA
ncbi:shikimate dehydrogenase [Aquincola tertiaricarbonis]|uniref:Shikimate dehydrogenase (NADP(+)) n=1 Tax=Aquincola tertiaricarbonis TaxID=391953 RepID=A0ABY4SAD5_AQUTE|nr:shikimate dehydrogenase [Aquincola tertiaricarbonis]URI08001.1 shikimate dehydrogenase [Aquincola tertiaricarbonis]